MTLFHNQVEMMEIDTEDWDLFMMEFKDNQNNLFKNQNINL